MKMVKRVKTRREKSQKIKYKFHVGVTWATVQLGMTHYDSSWTHDVIFIIFSEAGVELELELEENPLDDSEIISDYQLESLKLYDNAFDWLLNSQDQYCIISVIGKSRFGKSLAQGPFPCTSGL